MPGSGASIWFNLMRSTISAYGATLLDSITRRAEMARAVQTNNSEGARLERLLLIAGPVATVAMAVASALQGFGAHAIYLLAAVLVMLVLAFGPIFSARTARSLRRRGLAGLGLTFSLYVVGLAFLGFTDETTEGPLTWVSISLFAILFGVQSATTLQRSRVTRSHPTPRVVRWLRFSIVAVGATFLGVGAVNASTAVIETAFQHEGTASAHLIQAVISGGTGIVILIARRAVVAQVLIATGLAQLGFGIAALVGGATLFGVSLLSLAICGAAIAIGLWIERSTLTAVLLAIAALSAFGLSAASAFEVVKPAFATVFALLGLSLALASWFTFGVRDHSEDFPKPNEYRRWSLPQYWLWSICGAALCSGFLLAALGLLRPLAAGDWLVALSCSVASLFIVGSTVLGFFIERGSRRREFVQPLT